jgi:putative oxidoreductase
MRPYSPQSNESGNDFAKLILRVALAGFLLLHGLSKIAGGIGHITGMLSKAGMPEAFGYLVFVGEVIAPLLILVGFWTRPAALVIAINMVVAVLLAHTAEFFTLGKSGGWALELQGFFFITAIVVALQGAGRYSIGGANGRWN